MTNPPLEPVGAPMMCDVCGTRLNNHEQWAKGKLVSISWEHTGLFPEGTEPHDPVPVYLAPDEDPKTGFCDFCNSEQPRWSYPAAPFQMDVAERRTDTGNESIGWGSADNWAACHECHADIESGNWEKIERRYFSHSAVPKLHRTDLRRSLRALHRQFRLHRLGPPLRVKEAE